jgi:hypothetical protein
VERGRCVLPVAIESAALVDRDGERIAGGDGRRRVAVREAQDALRLRPDQRLTGDQEEREEKPSSEAVPHG